MVTLHLYEDTCKISLSIWYFFSQTWGLVFLRGNGVLVQVWIAREKLLLIALALPERAPYLFIQVLCIFTVLNPHYKCCQYCVRILVSSLKAQPLQNTLVDSLLLDLVTVFHCWMISSNCLSLEMLKSAITFLLKFQKHGILQEHPLTYCLWFLDYCPMLS